MDRPAPRPRTRHGPLRLRGQSSDRGQRRRGPPSTTPVWPSGRGRPRPGSARPGVSSVIYIGGNHVAYPVALFGAAGAGCRSSRSIPAGPDQLASQINAHPAPSSCTATNHWRGADSGHAAQADSIPSSRWPASRPAAPPPGSRVALRAALYQRHHGCAQGAIPPASAPMSDLLGTVEFSPAPARRGARWWSVPPYHIAGGGLTCRATAAPGSTSCTCDRFNPEDWPPRRCGAQGITRAMVFPTMPARVVTHLGGADSGDADAPAALSYGGARMPPPRSSPGPAPLLHHRLRQRLRADRDQLHHRPPRSRGSSGGSSWPRSADPRPASARSAGPCPASSSRCATTTGGPRWPKA